MSGSSYADGARAHREALDRVAGEIGRNLTRSELEVLRLLQSLDAHTGYRIPLEHLRQEGGARAVDIAITLVGHPRLVSDDPPPGRGGQHFSLTPRAVRVLAVLDARREASDA